MEYLLLILTVLGVIIGILYLYSSQYDYDVYKKFIDKIIGEEQTPLHVFNCTTLVWISDIQSIQVMANEYKVYFDLSFCSGLQVRVLTYTDSRYSQHLGDIRKLFINAIGHSYLPLYESELKIGDSVIRLTEKKIDD